MHIDWWTIGLQTVNFGILVWLLYRFLYKPVLTVIEARKAEARKQLDAARAIEESAKAQLAGIEQQRAAIAGEREAALTTATTQAQELAERRRAQAEQEARALLEGARKTLSVEREHAFAEARRMALDLGADFAQRLLAEVPMQLRAEAWIARIEQYLSAASESERSSLVQQLTDGRPLIVVTASALPPEAGDAWRDRLQTALGARLALSFEVNPALIAGVELRFPTAILRFSWQSALAKAQAETGSRGNAR